MYVCSALYLFVLSYLLFFSHYRSAVSGVVDYNIIPFRSIVRDISSYNGLELRMLTDNFFGNIFAFLPLGFFSSLLFKRLRSIGMIFLLSMGVSVTVELLQLTFKLGSLDIDDVILNTLGGTIGYITFKLLQKGRGYIVSSAK
ncbi:VanZ family protein [Bacillus alkalisoli]|uniref:VanZ family protein n=1 Tax=Bacillus alkalisoli TaxID=2011008 RepID=UPI001D0CF936